MEEYKSRMLDYLVCKQPSLMSDILEYMEKVVYKNRICEVTIADIHILLEGHFSDWRYSYECNIGGICFTYEEEQQIDDDDYE
jgi:hypothetical protein